MNYKYFFSFIFIFILSCEVHDKKIIYKENKINTNEIGSKEKVLKKSIIINDSEKLKIYNNKGFALVYSDSLYKNKIVNKKINNDTLVIYNKNLLKNIPVKITNLVNGKYLISKIDNSIDYPSFYNSVISKRIMIDLNIDVNEPYIQIETLNSKNIYVANEAKTFDEEKNVANKAPIDAITIQNISTNKTKKLKKFKTKAKNFNYIIKFADFYFEDSAIMLKERLVNEFNIKEISIKKISKDNFRVFLGPFKDLGSIKKAYNSIGNIEFENIEIIKL